MEASDWSIVTEVALEDAAVAVQLVVRQPRGQEVRGLEAGPGVVTNYLRERKHVYIDLEYELSIPDLGEVAGAGVLEHGVHQPVAGLGQVRPVNAVTVPEHNLRLDETLKSRIEASGSDWSRLTRRPPRLLALDW